MRFPSLSHFYRAAWSTLTRFSIVMLCAVVAAVGGVLAIHHPRRPGEFLDVLLAAQLGIPLIFALGVYSEKRAWNKWPRFYLELAACAALIAYYASLPDWITPTTAVRFAQFNVGLHLLVAILPYARYRESDGFWQYNKTLFLRFLTAALYSGVLYSGLAMALVAVDQLLDVHVDDKMYTDLVVVVGFVFHTWFFLGGVPRDLPTLKKSSDYPHGLKVFTQYILVPIVLVYLSILTIYLVKIVVTRQWPSGLIGYLVSAVSVAGIFSLLLVHPIRDSKENRWIRSFSRWFYVWILPAIVMLLMAIGKRIAQYGITENRYFLAVLALWLLVIALYFTLSRGKRIRAIPLSLCVVALITSVGPWGAFGVARSSQTARLASLLSRNGVLVNGRIERSSSSIPFGDRREISAVLTYLVEHHGTRSIAPWFGDALSRIDTTSAGTGPSRRRQSSSRVKDLLEYYNVEYVARWQHHGQAFRYTADTKKYVYDVSGYGALYRFGFHPGSADTLATASDSLQLHFDDELTKLSVLRHHRVLLTIDVMQLTDKLNRYTREHSSGKKIPPRIMRVLAHNDSIDVAIYFDRIIGTKEDGVPHIHRIGGDMLFILK